MLRMTRKSVLGLGGLLGMLAAALTAAPVMAASNGSLTFDSAYNEGQDCSYETLFGDFTVTPDGNDFAGVDFFAIIGLDGYGTVIDNDFESAANSLTPVNGTFSVDAASVNLLAARPVTIRLYDVGNVGALDANSPAGVAATLAGTLLAQIVVDPALEDSTCELLPFVGGVGGGTDTGEGCVDDRLNCRYGDEYAAIYARRDANGNPALHIYCVRNGRGTLNDDGVITAGDFAGFPTNPTRPTLVLRLDAADGCPVAVSIFVLPDGRYQINIGPDSKGNTVVMQFSGLPPSNIVFQRLDADR